MVGAMRRCLGDVSSERGLGCSSQASQGWKNKKWFSHLRESHPDPCPIVIRIPAREVT